MARWHRRRRVGCPIGCQLGWTVGGASLLLHAGYVRYYAHLFEEGGPGGLRFPTPRSRL